MEVQPIRNSKQIKAICAYLKNRNEKYYVMFVLGIQTGLRVSDVLNLKVSDIEQMRNKKIIEKKTSKKRFLYLNNKTYNEINNYITKNDLAPDQYLINSRKKHNNRCVPISRVQAYRILKEAGEACGFHSMGTHTMRKTFGYHYYQKTHDVATLMHIFNHASQSITLRYIGIENEQIEESLKDFVLF